jgi:excisionase family DNA binding protein
MLKNDDNQKQSPGGLMLATEAAAYLRVPVATIYAWRYRGLGPPSIKVGRHLRFRRADIDWWLNGLGDSEARAENQGARVRKSTAK